MKISEKLFSDLDGPILDVSTKYYQIYVDIVKELSGTPISKEAYWQNKRNKVPESTTLIASDLDPDDLSYYQKIRKEKIETNAYLTYDKVWPELLLYISNSPLRGKITLVTFRKNPRTLKKELCDLGISSWFKDVLSINGDVNHRDRHEGKVNLIRDHYKKDLNGFFIGDTETDIRAGKVLGLKSIAVTFGIRNADILMREEPDIILNSPAALVNWVKTYS
ncbi:MAG: HAD family hydrolase [Opitutae bacterium]|nr:HAD family hydrolase [Opitutae bacterium]